MLPHRFRGLCPKSHSSAGCRDQEAQRTRSPTRRRQVSRPFQRANKDRVHQVLSSRACRYDCFDSIIRGGGTLAEYFTGKDHSIGQQLLQGTNVATIFFGMQGTTRPLIEAGSSKTRELFCDDISSRQYSSKNIINSLLAYLLHNGKGAVVCVSLGEVVASPAEEGATLSLQDLLATQTAGGELEALTKVQITYSSLHTLQEHRSVRSSRPIRRREVLRGPRAPRKSPCSNRRQWQHLPCS